LEGNPESEVGIRTVTTPNNGQRTVAVRRLRIAGEVDESQVLLSMIEDRTDEAKIEGRGSVNVSRDKRPREGPPERSLWPSAPSAGSCPRHSALQARNRPIDGRPHHLMLKTNRRGKARKHLPRPNAIPPSMTELGPRPVAEN